MTRVKSVVYKMPDPSLAFMAETFVILLLRYVYPRAVCCILARIIIPVLLFVTIGVTVVWRRTGVICADGARRFKPVPDAAMIVSKGEAMRKREFAIVNAEARLNSQQIRLENLRKEIQLRLPPQASIADMLQRENDM